MTTYSYLDLYPYVIILLLLVLISYAKLPQKTKSNFCFVIFFLFFACRYEIGWDYNSYLFLLHQGMDYYQVQSYAPLSKLFFYIACELNFYPILFILFSLTHLLLLKITIDKLSVNVTMSWVFYFLIPIFFINDLSTIRQAVATECVFFSYLFLRENNIKYYIIMIIIACMFHNSAICGILLFLANRYIFSKKTNWIVFSLSFVFSQFVPVIMGYFINISIFSHFYYYMDNIESHSFNTLQYIFYAINIVVLMYYDKFKTMDEEYTKYIQFGNLGVVLYNLFSFEPTTAFRISTCYMLFWILLLPSLSKTRSIKIPTFVYYIPFVFCFFYLLHTYIDTYNLRIVSTRAVFPYQFWWNHL